MKNDSWYKRTWLWIAVAFALLILGLGTWSYITGRLPFWHRAFMPGMPEVGIVDREAVSTEWIELFFSDSRTGRLVSESREIIALEDPADRVRVIVEELLAGSRANLTATLPETAHIRDVFLDNQGGLYLDFSREFVSDQLVGTAAELAAVGSIMKTIAGNVTDIVRVQLLVDGSEIQTINGHLRADQPFMVAEWN